MSSYHRVPSTESSDDHHGDHDSLSSSINADNNNNNTSSSSSAGGSGTAAVARNRTASERAHDKIVALLWVLLAAGVAYLTDFWAVITLQQRRGPEGVTPSEGTNGGTTSTDSPSAVPNRLILQAAALCLGAIVLLAAYLLLYLPCVKGLNDSSAWHVYCPRVVPSMSGLSVLTLLLLIRGTWPVWGCLAPLVIGVQLLGVLFLTHLIPWPC